MTYEDYCIKFSLDYDLVPELEKYHNITDGKALIDELRYESYLMYLEASNTTN